MKKTLSKIMLMSVCTMFFSSQNFASSLDSVSVSENRITNVRDPIEKTDAATKNYVDNKIEGIEKPPAILQTEGKSETAVMSQKAVSSIIAQQKDALQEHIDKTINKNITRDPSKAVDPNDITLKTGLYFPKSINLPINNSTGILENKVVYNEDGSLFCIYQFFYRYRNNQSWKRTYNTSLSGTIVNTWTEWENTSENAIFDRIYPVGSIYMSVNSTNPSELFGGTWSAWAQGRIPLGVGSNGNTNFTTPETTGGSSEHRHDWKIAIHWHYGEACGENQSSGTGAYRYSNNKYDGWNKYLNEKTLTVNNSTSGSSKTAVSDGKYSQGNTSNTSTLPPYITCYMWKRTA